MKTMTKDLQSGLTPKRANKLLVDGNKRFVKNVKALRDLKKQVKETGKGQYPFAVVLGCIDSRAPAELIFDQGIGDIFNVRVAGNIVNEDVLGSLEYACKVAGSKIVVVLGHTKCGAVMAACEHIKLGNITPLLQKIKPAVDVVASLADRLDENFADDVALQNVHLSINRIKKESPILYEMDKNDEIDIVGALYDVSTGKVKFLHKTGNLSRN